MKPFDRVILVIAVAAIAAAIVVGRFDLVPNAPLCWSVILLGRECPGCGLTRSFALIGRGAFHEANLMNPLGPILFVYLIALIAIRIGRATTSRFRWWWEIDVAFGAAVVIALVGRTITFYA